MSKREGGGLLAMSRGLLIKDQSFDGVSHPPGKRNPYPIIAIDSGMVSMNFE